MPANKMVELNQVSALSEEHESLNRITVLYTLYQLQLHKGLV